LSNPENIAGMLYWTTPLIFSGLAVAIAFKAGLFNIGGQGQMMIGGLFSAIWAAEIIPKSGINFMNTKIFLIPTTILIGFIAGGIWGMIPGYLKAHRGAHEVIVTIMMNLLAINVATYLIGSNSYSPFLDKTSKDAHSQTDKISPEAQLQPLFPEVSSRLNISLFLGVVLIILIYILITKTNFGYKMRAVGLNSIAAESAGIDTKKITTLTMALSGGIAGLGGTFMVMGTYPFRYQIGMEGTLGFDGIAVSLIAQNSPFGILIAALFFGFLSQSAYNIDIKTEDVPPDLLYILQALVIIFAATPLISKKIISQLVYTKNFLKKKWNQASDPTEEKQ
ncbi:MAG: ABC transporter permease, partial [Candidatus Heimdallarchaeota archaeon]|nr:ABC transporter permease [Candidatus Heimdallarchaeota archaeon]